MIFRFSSDAVQRSRTHARRRRWYTKSLTAGARAHIWYSSHRQCVIHIHIQHIQHVHSISYNIIYQSFSMYCSTLHGNNDNENHDNDDNHSVGREKEIYANAAYITLHAHIQIYIYTSIQCIKHVNVNTGKWWHIKSITATLSNSPCRRLRLRRRWNMIYSTNFNKFFTSFSLARTHTHTYPAFYILTPSIGIFFSIQQMKSS